MLMVWTVEPDEAPIVIVFASAEVPMLRMPAFPPVPTSSVTVPGATAPETFPELMVTAPEASVAVTGAPEAIVMLPVVPEVVVVPEAMAIAPDAPAVAFPVLRFKAPETPAVEIPVVSVIALVVAPPAVLIVPAPAN